MLLDVQPDSPVPIFQQIIDQVIFGIAAGGLSEGTMIPSVRDLASRHLVHPNTVAKAYQELERLGVLEAKRGRGMAVTAEALSTCRTRRQAIVRERIRAALREAKSSALPDDEIRSLVEQELHHVNGHPRPRGNQS
jgi:GntR family transcriptional regulator